MDDVLRDFVVWVIGFAGVSAVALTAAHVAASKWRERRQARKPQQSITST
jgi:hypothetical protein